MGVQVGVKLYAPNEEAAEDAARAAFDRFRELDNIASDYRPDSELMRLCKAAGGPPVKVSDDLFVMLERSQRLAELSDGAFDITVGPLVKLWREARKSGKLPDPQAIEAARKVSGWQKLKLDPEKRTAQLAVPGMSLDLGGIAKGYACDQAMAAICAKGVTSALVEAGGDIVVSGAPPGRDGWRIEIVAERPSEHGKIVPLTHCAISTSGDLEQYVVIGGRRYSHVVDPRTGIGTTDRALVTVISGQGVTTDGLATAGCVMGEAARELLNYYPCTQMFVRVAKDE